MGSAPNLVCGLVVNHASSRRRSRHPHRSGTAGPPRCQHDDALHSRTQPWSATVRSPADRMCFC